VIPGSPEEANWRARHPGNKRSAQRSFATGTTGAHTAAQNGDLLGVMKAVSKDKAVVNKTDSNGWTALHESARAGHKDIVKYLYESGADLNARTHHARGGTALHFAKEKLGEDHEVVSYLESLGAIDIGPDL